MNDEVYSEYIFLNALFPVNALRLISCSSFSLRLYFFVLWVWLRLYLKSSRPGIFSNVSKSSRSASSRLKNSILFEQKILNEVVGSQDQIAATYGGFNKIIFKKSGDFSVNKILVKKNRIELLNKNLILIYTGQKRTAQDIAKSYVDKLKNVKEKYVRRILEYVDESELILKNGDMNDFGKLLHESWNEKKKLSSKITNSNIDQLYNYAIKNGALGGKILGAGGGGFFLFYVPHNKQKNFINKFNKFINVPFKFSNTGSQIFFNSKKK